MRPESEPAVLTAGDRLARAADRLQQRHPWLAFPVAVAKKFSDDHAHNLAALVAYFAFVSIFPQPWAASR